MTKSQPSPADLIAKLDLQPHPEGGWYRETWRAQANEGERASATAIHFLLARHQVSHWHRVDAAELWLWHAGSVLELMIAEEERAAISSISLGGDVLSGQMPQALVPIGFWQSARPKDGWALVSCVVSPGFEFSGFELAPSGWSPQGD